MEVSTIIKQAAEDLGMLYLRATDYDANVKVEEIDLGELPILIYNNLLEVEYTLGGGIVAEYPIEIKILKLGYFDNDTEDADFIINACRKLGESLVNLLLENELINTPDTYTIDALNTVEIYDELMSGIQLNVDLGFVISC